MSPSKLYLRLGLMLLAGCGFWAEPVRASDHADAPLTRANPSGDITDVYAFLSGDEQNFVFIVNMNPSAGDGDGFPKRGVQIFFDTDMDAVQDVTFKLKFTKVKNGTQRLVLKAPGAGGKLAAGRTTAFGDAPNVIDGQDGIMVFAGARDDPFFGNQEFLERPAVCPPAVDSYSGQNVNSIVIEVPRGFFEEDFVGTFAKTKQDRAGLPLVNTLFVPPHKLAGGGPALKNRFNSTPPADQFDEFGDVIIDTLSIFNDPNTAREGASQLVPDVLYLDANGQPGFPNGRRPGDDVVDFQLTLLTGGIEDKDCVRRNDFPFLNEMPHLGGPSAIVNTGFLNIRSEPATEGEIVGTLPGGTSVQLLDRTDDGDWFLVDVAGTMGWVNGDFLILDGD